MGAIAMYIVSALPHSNIDKVTSTIVFIIHFSVCHAVSKFKTASICLQHVINGTMLGMRILVRFSIAPQYNMTLFSPFHCSVPHDSLLSLPIHRRCNVLLHMHTQYQLTALIFLSSKKMKIRKLKFSFANDCYQIFKQ